MAVPFPMYLQTLEFQLTHMNLYTSGGVELGAQHKAYYLIVSFMLSTKLQTTDFKIAFSELQSRMSTSSSELITRSGHTAHRLLQA